MIINQQTMGSVFTAFNTLFTRGMGTAPSAYKQIAMTVPSVAREEVYAWLGQFPGMREWLGSRVVKNLVAHGFTIVNKDFESTVSVPRNDIQDDRFGVFGPVMEELGRAAGELPDQLIFSLLSAGFVNDCYDGQPFFDADHPVGSEATGGVTSVSNIQAGSETPWFLLDTSRPMKPLIYQERMPYKLVSKDRPEDDNVFDNKEFVYGTDGRSNAGYGLWQLAFASKAELTPANYEAARAAMMAFTGDEGRPLGIKPDVLVAPPSLEGAVMRLLNNGTRIEMVDTTPVSVQNEWAQTAKPIVTAWLI